MESLAIVWYNITMKLKKILILFTLCAVSAGVWAVTPGPGSMYATDAYPGFDGDSNILQQKRKEQRREPLGLIASDRAVFKHENDLLGSACRCRIGRCPFR